MKTNKHRHQIRFYLLAVMATLLGFASGAQATPLGFHGITNNDPGDVAIGEAQLSVDVTEPGSNQVLFSFLNSGPDASSVAQIYFDDDSLLFEIDSIDDSNSGVDFDEGGAPPNLPGGNSISPPFTASFRATADNPAPSQGVNPGESVGIQFNLISGQTFDDVIAQLASGALRIGLHVQSFASGGSEAFVNDPPSPVPLPAAVWLLGSGLTALVALRCGRRRRSTALDRRA